MVLFGKFVNSPWPRRLLIGVPLALAFGALAGYVTAVRIGRNLPPLEPGASKVVTRIFDAQGGVLLSVGEERRFVVRYDQISPHFFNALIAVEDAEFMQHKGVIPSAMFKRVLLNLMKLRRPAGGSTLTQQLAKNYFLTPERSVGRKLKEMVLAIRLERNFSKQQILELYANKVNYGHAHYGIEEASRFYFGKSAPALTIPEAAFLAGVVQSPTNNSPLNNPARALARRNHVLSRMVETGKLDAKLAEQYKAEPLLINPHSSGAALAPYFVDEVRKAVDVILGDGRVMAGGLDIYTTLDPALQRTAEKAVDYGLSLYERRHGFRKEDILNLQDGGLDPHRLDYPEWSAPVAAGDFVHAVVKSVTHAVLTVQLGIAPASPLATVGLKDSAWSGCKKLDACFKAGDILFVRVKGAEKEGSEQLLASLEQEPEINAAFVAIDNPSGAVRAMVGGFDYRISKFNRATQARRQTGSTFKPLLYAAALSAGATPADRLTDTPTSYLQDFDDCKKEYTPKNSTRAYSGFSTVRRSLEDSINVSTVELLSRAGYIGTLELAKKAGITAPLRHYPSLALGAMEISLLEVTSAYTIFPMEGVHTSPYLINRIVDREGNNLYQNATRSETATTPQVAAITTDLMRGVIQRGTARAAASLGGPLAGKTGTTDDYSNAWFVGFTPTLTAGAWVGYDNPKSLGRGEVGGVAALPIWSAFMRDARADPLIKGTQFPEPTGLTRVLIDRRTGKRAAPDTGCSEEDLFEELFAAGNEPQEYCNETEHLRASLPWMLQPFELSAELKLKISPSQLDRLLLKFPLMVTVDAERTRIDAATFSKSLGDKHVTMPLLLIDEPISGPTEMGSEDWKCGQRTIVVNSSK